MSRVPFILLINPWITDFAAYDLWAKPMGLAILGALLRQGGCGVAFIDCLNRHDLQSGKRQGLYPGKNRRFGTGKYPKVPIDKPAPYQEFARTYYRYGIHPDSLRRRLRDLDRPDVIWVTGIMTYWYPGLVQTISTIREVFPDVPVWLGGIYARLCPEHARRTIPADRVITEPTHLLPRLIAEETGFELSNISNWSAIERYPRPAFDLLGDLDYVPLLAGLGCPFHCPYCASRALQPRTQRRSAGDLEGEICFWQREFGIEDFAFYDDALLLNGGPVLWKTLGHLIDSGLPVRFHTPNAVHIRALSPEWCRRLKAAGFVTIRLGLETVNAAHQRQWGGKVETRMFVDAVANLFAAGFEPEQVGVYILCGLPGQTRDEVAASVEFVEGQGVFPFLAEYSPIPGTAMWEQARRVSRYDIASEPLYHNNTVLACRRPDFSYDDLLRLKKIARDARRRLLNLPAIHKG